MKLTSVITITLTAALLCGCAPDPELVDLADRADKAVIDAGDSLGREFANRLRSEHRPAWLKYFKGEGEKPPLPHKKTRQDVIDDIEKLIGLIKSAETWPKPGKYRIPKATSAPVIDGKLTDKAWEKAMVWNDIYLFNKTEKGGPATTWKMLWDDKNLYFAFDCKDPDVVAPIRKRDGGVWDDDCVEMFILPEFNFRTYWEIIISPSGSIFDSVECKRAKQWGMDLDPSKNVKGLETAQVVHGTLNKSDDVDQGYTVEVAVPFSSLPGYSRSRPAAGHQIHLMLARLDKTAGVKKIKPYAFRPLQGWGQNIWNHAVMELSSESK
jgi:hypothetical protein